MIYFTSDTHFCHDKDFLYSPRGFKNEYDMNRAIIENWNATVNPEDDVYHLGDVLLSDTEGGLACLKQLKGRIHIIRGNHDSDSRIKLYKDCWNVIEVCEGKFLKVGKQSFFLSHYPCLTSNYDSDKPLKARIISLCGHSHTTDRFADFDKGLIYHVELDAHDLKPVSAEQIIEDIKEKMG